MSKSFEAIEGQNASDDEYRILSFIKQKKYKQNWIFYHGTSSAFTDNIEKVGWKVNFRPYEIDDIKFLEGLSFLDPVGLTYLINRTKYPPPDGPWFDPNYSNAFESYARNPGGEFMKELFKAITDINTKKNMRTIVQLRSDLRNWIENERRITSLNTPDLDKKLRDLALIDNDARFGKKLCRILSYIRNKYSQFIKGSYPVVYGVHVDPEVFTCNDTVNLCARVDIEPGNIILRVDYKVIPYKQHDLN